MKKVLINVSNHPDGGWSEEQRAGWDNIVTIKFPEIAPEWDEDSEGFANCLEAIKKKILLYGVAFKEGSDDEYEIFLNIQGEFSFCYEILKWIIKEGLNIRVVVPTTKREAVEEKQPDGTVKKTAVFKFVRWREVKIK